MLKSLPVVATPKPALPGSAQAQFVGTLSLIPDPSSLDGSRKIPAENFGSVDPQGVGWEAGAGNKTDGASIPRIF